MAVTKDMLIADILHMKEAEKMADILTDAGMHCFGCLMARGETLEQAAEVHGLDVDELVVKLNAAAE